MKRPLPVWNLLWWEHCTCAGAELGSRGRGGARWCAGGPPGQQGAGSLTPSSAFSPLGGPFSSVPPPVGPWLQPWIESNAKFKIKSNAKLRLFWRWISMKNKSVVHYSVSQSTMLITQKNKKNKTTTENARSLKHCTSNQRWQINCWDRRANDCQAICFEKWGPYWDIDEEGNCTGLCTFF